MHRPEALKLFLITVLCPINTEEEEERSLADEGQTLMNDEDLEREDGKRGKEEEGQRDQWKEDLSFLSLDLQLHGHGEGVHGVVGLNVVEQRRPQRERPAAEVPHPVGPKGAPAGVPPPRARPKR